MASALMNPSRGSLCRLVNLVALDFASRRESVRSLPISVAKISTTALPSVQLKSVGEKALLEDRFVDGGVHCAHGNSALVLDV